LKILVSVVRFRPGPPRTSFTQRPLMQVGVVVSGIRSPRLQSISGLSTSEQPATKSSNFFQKPFVRSAYAGIDLNRESSQDARTLLKVRRLLETHDLTRKIFETINGHLAAQGLMMAGRDDRRCHAGRAPFASAAQQKTRGSLKPELRPEDGSTGKMHQNWQNSPFGCVKM
jgi:hypothetical protein